MLYKRKENYLLKEIAGDNILIARGDEALVVKGVFVFNETGATIWNAMNNAVSEDDLSDILVTSYGIEKKQAEMDVSAFIKKMQENQLIEIIG